MGWETGVLVRMGTGKDDEEASLLVPAGVASEHASGSGGESADAPTIDAPHFPLLASNATVLADTITNTEKHVLPKIDNRRDCMAKDRRVSHGSCRGKLDNSPRDGLHEGVVPSVAKSRLHTCAFCSLSLTWLYDLVIQSELHPITF
jgi:hypothetical protein